MILTVWRMISTWSWAHGAGACTLGESVNLKDTMRSAKHWEKQAGSTGWEAERGEYLLGLPCLLWNLFGEGPFLRLEVKVRKASWGLRVAQLPVLFLSWRTKVNARFCLPFLLRLKAVRCEGGRFFSFCHLGEWSCLLSTLSLILRHHYSKKRKLEGHLWSRLLFTNAIHSLLLLDSISSTSVTFPIFGFQGRSKRMTAFSKVQWRALCSKKSGCY